MPKRNLTRKDMVVDENMQEIPQDPEKLMELRKDKPKTTSRIFVQPQQRMMALRQSSRLNQSTSIDETREKWLLKPSLKEPKDPKMFFPRDGKSPAHYREWPSERLKNMDPHFRRIMKSGSRWIRSIQKKRDRTTRRNNNPGTEMTTMEEISLERQMKLTALKIHAERKASEKSKAGERSLKN